jgi:peptidoglycan hydrolase-like protein with peptidoglycan-binding domain
MVTDTLVFTYMVSYRDSTPDLQYESESALVVTQGTITDAHSLVPVRVNLPAVDSLSSLAGNKNIALNTDSVTPVTTAVPSVEEVAPLVAVTTPEVVGPTQIAQRKPNQVVLASKNKTAHCPAIHGYWKLGDKGLQVRKIQMFLNVYEGQKLAVDGIYGYQTRQAVKEFQRNHKNEILSPWGLSKVEATGYWYKTTSKAANYLVGCDSESIELENGAEVDEYSPTFNPYIEALPQPFYRFIRNQYRELSRRSSSVAQNRDDSGKYRGMSMLSEEVQSQAPPVMK